jgi:nicotinamide mononucleotide transporter
MSTLEIIAVLVSVATVWLTTARHILCWPVGLVSVALYGKVFFDARLYSDMLLQGCFAVMMIYGWLSWRADPDSAAGIAVQRLSRASLAGGLAAGLAGALLLGGLMARFTDAAVPWLDAALTSYSLLAQYWTARKSLANWWLWIVVDIVYTGLFIAKGLTLTAALYAAFVGLAVLGLRRWQQAMVALSDCGSSAAASR